MLFASIGWCLAVIASGIAIALYVRGPRAERALRAPQDVRDARDVRDVRDVREETDRTLLNALLDASPVALVLCADSGRIVLDNAAARRLFFADQSAEGQNFLRLAANGPSDIQAALLEASDQIVGLHVDGQYESFHFSRRKLNHRGEPHTLILVRSMTREVAAHDIDVLKRVVRLISHEVNNSLAPITSLVHSARTIVASGERLNRLDRVFDTVEERSRHLAEFIAGYAGLARLPRPAPRSLEWKSILDRLSALYPDAQLTAPDGSQGYFDPGQLEQALINLLKNAYESGGERESVQLKVSPLEDHATELKVLDRGRGFTPDALEHALLPFYTTKPGGTGVGLALVREIVHAHGGRLTLGGHEGGGAEVRVWLPGPSRVPDLESRTRLTLTRA